MKLIFACVLFVFCSAFFNTEAIAADPIAIPLTDGGFGYLGPFAEYYVDTTGATNISDLLSKNPKFSGIEVEHPNFGISNSVYWVRFKIDTRNYSSSFWYLLQDFQFVHDIKVYVPTKTGYQAIHHQNSLGGNLRFFDTRSIVFKVAVPTHDIEKAYIYLRLNSGGNAVDMDFKWSSEKALLEYTTTSNFFFGGFYGALGALLVYNLFLFVFIKEKTYLAYVYYMSTFFLMFFYINGYVSVFTSIDPSSDYLSVLLLLPLHGAILFASRVLTLREQFPILNRILNALKAVTVLSAALAITLLDQSQVLVISVVLNPIVMLTLLVCGIASLRKGNRPAKYYMLGWSVMIPLVILYGLNASSIVPSNLIATYGLQFAGIWEAVLFSVALASKTREYMKARDDALSEKLASKRVTAYTTKLLENERKQIATEIHDSFNASLVAIKYKLAAIKQHSPSNEIVSIVESLEDLVSEKYTDARKLVKRLRPESIDTLGLASALSELVSSFNVDGSACLFKFSARGNFSQVSDEVPIAVYRIVSECLTNVIKHSNAQLCSVTLNLDEGTRILEVMVVDNGNGFDLSTRNGGIGLISMRERANTIGCEIKIDSKIGYGTKIQLSMKVDSNDRERIL